MKNADLSSSDVFKFRTVTVGWSNSNGEYYASAKWMNFVCRNHFNNETINIIVWWQVWVPESPQSMCLQSLPLLSPSFPNLPPLNSQTSDAFVAVAALVLPIRNSSSKKPLFAQFHYEWCVTKMLLRLIEKSHMEVEKIAITFNQIFVYRHSLSAIVRYESSCKIGNIWVRLSVSNECFIWAVHSLWDAIGVSNERWSHHIASKVISRILRGDIIECHPVEALLGEWGFC